MLPVACQTSGAPTWLRSSKVGSVGRPLRGQRVDRLDPGQLGQRGQPGRVGGDRDAGVERVGAVQDRPAGRGPAQRPLDAALLALDRRGLRPERATAAAWPLVRAFAAYAVAAGARSSSIMTETGPVRRAQRGVDAARGAAAHRRRSGRRGAAHRGLARAGRRGPGRGRAGRARLQAAGDAGPRWRPRRRTGGAARHASRAPHPPHRIASNCYGTAHYRPGTTAPTAAGLPVPPVSAASVLAGPGPVQLEPGLKKTAPPSQGRQVATESHRNQPSSRRAPRTDNEKKGQAPGSTLSSPARPSPGVPNAYRQDDARTTDARRRPGRPRPSSVAFSRRRGPGRAGPSTPRGPAGPSAVPRS